jgi:hypothetical protein
MLVFLDAGSRVGFLDLGSGFGFWIWVFGVLQDDGSIWSFGSWMLIFQEFRILGLVFRMLDLFVGFRILDLTVFFRILDVGFRIQDSWFSQDLVSCCLLIQRCATEGEK